MPGRFERMTMSDGASIGVCHAVPAGERRGGVVLVQAIFGVTEHIRDMAEEYPGHGYEVLAPALFEPSADLAKARTLALFHANGG